MIVILTKSFYKHGYLLILAAWLYTLSFMVTNYWAYNASPKRVTSKLEAKIAHRENRFEEIIADTALLARLTTNTNNRAKQALLTENIGFFVYSTGSNGTPTLQYWNNNRFIINTAELAKKDGNYFVTYQNGNFEIIKRTVFVRYKKLTVAAVIPVRWHYFIENDYLQSEFDEFTGLDNQYEICNDTKAYPVFNSYGDILFKIKPKEGYVLVTYDWLTIVFRVLAIVLFFIFVNIVSNTLVKHVGFIKGFAFLLIVLVAFRLLSYSIDFPFDVSRLPLFDPSIYASNFLHPSLGDLFINSILLYWVVIFFKFYSFRNKLPTYLISKPAKVVLLATLMGLLLLFVGIMRSLVQDGKISFDVTNFFSLTIYSLISFIILSFLVLSFYNLTHILLRPLIESNTHIIYQVLGITVAGLTYLTFAIGNPSTISNMVVLAWFIVYLILVNKRKKDFYTPLVQSSIFIFWVMIFALSVAALVIYQNKVVEFEQRKKMAERIATQSDPNGENLLNIAIAGINDTAISNNFNRFTQEYANRFLKDSLINENFSGYLNKFETRIYTYDSSFKPLFNEDSVGYNTFNAIANYQGKRTNLPYLYTFRNADNQLTYLLRKEFTAKKTTLGYFFVVIKPKQYKSEALYPELFKQLQDVSIDPHTNYAYALYTNGQLVLKVNDYAFPLQIAKTDIAPFQFLQRTQNNNSELWYNGGNGKVVIIAKRNAFALEAATLFAYLFCVFLIVISLFHVGNYFIQTKLQGNVLQQLFSFNIRSQIHATILFISAFSFFVIGIATISFFYARFKQNNQERLSKTIQTMATEIQTKTQQVTSALRFDDVLTYSDVGIVGDLERKINEVSQVHNVDINLYTTDGTLLVSTQPYIYSKLLLSDKMDATAFGELHNNQISRFVQTEQIGNLSYLSMYIPIVDQSGAIYAYLNIPYLNSQAELNQEISGFLATLINLNAFIFLLAGAIAFVLTNRIVDSFSVIGNKMKEVGLGKVNEAIKWQKNDEIGVLVNEYNKMVQKLEQSAKALAQSEREGAWREMARQVAHEIKNPLTPMKLSMQYLQQAVDSDSPNSKELTKRVATTLVEQIDQLAKIASDFSQFANIGYMQLEKLSITDVLNSVIQLHKQGAVNIQWELQEGNYFIIADKIQLNRLFTNLVKNAIEVERNNGAGIEIRIQQFIQNNQAIIRIADNGVGIPRHVQAQLFTPNFTTKTSGTGLGLAICKGIVEKMNGTVTFTTQEGVGTIFFVVLPLV